MEPTNMHRKHTDADAKLSSGVRGLHHPDQNLDVPQSVWSAFVGRLDNFLKCLRQVGHKPDQPNKSGESAQPCERHVCRLNPSYTCACPSGACANDDATYRHARGPFIPTEQRVRSPEPNALGNFRCPVSGKLCSSFVCRDWCEGSGSGATLNNDRRDAAPTYNSGNT